MTRQVPARGDPDHTPLTDGGYTVSHPEPGTIEHLHLCCEVDGECSLYRSRRGGSDAGEEA